MRTSMIQALKLEANAQTEISLLLTFSAYSLQPLSAFHKKICRFKNLLEILLTRGVIPLVFLVTRNKIVQRVHSCWERRCKVDQLFFQFFCFMLSIISRSEWWFSTCYLGGMCLNSLGDLSRLATHFQETLKNLPSWTESSFCT